VQVGDLVKWTIPNEEGTMIGHLGIVLKILKKRMPRGQKTALIHFSDFNRASWFLEEEVEKLNAVCR